MSPILEIKMKTTHKAQIRETGEKNESVPEFVEVKKRTPGLIITKGTFSNPTEAEMNENLRTFFQRRHLHLKSSTPDK
jgi:hypothetical protein